MRRLLSPGFTLLELLVAVAVLSVLALLSFRGLTSLIDAEAHVRIDAERWASVSRFTEQAGRDLSLAVEPPLFEGATLLVRRRSEADAASADIAPRRVGFRMRNERLEYLSWPAEGATAAQPAVMPFLENVTALEWRTLDAAGDWRPALPDRADATASARAIEARLTLRGGERISRLFVLR